jgi:Phage Terminase
MWSSAMLEPALPGRSSAATWRAGQAHRRGRLGVGARGLVTTTRGNVADYDYIREQVNRDREAFEVAEIAYDPWNSSQLVTDLMNDGAELVSMRQGFASMSGPAKQLQRLMLEGTPEAPVLRHGRNPCVRWLVDNLAVAMNPRRKREARQGPRRGKDRRGGGSDHGCGPSHARLPARRSACEDDHKLELGCSSCSGWRAEPWHSSWPRAS